MNYCWRVEKSTGRLAYFGHINDKPSLNTPEYEKVFKSYQDRPNSECKWDFETESFVPCPILTANKKVRDNQIEAKKLLPEIKSIVDRHKVELELNKVPTLTQEKYLEFLNYYEQLLNVSLSDDPDIEFPVRPADVQGMSVIKKK